MYITISDLSVVGRQRTTDQGQNSLLLRNNLFARRAMARYAADLMVQLSLSGQPAGYPGHEGC
jgi:hypothetical protein